MDIARCKVSPEQTVDELRSELAACPIVESVYLLQTPDNGRSLRVTYLDENHDRWDLLISQALVKSPLYDAPTLAELLAPILGNTLVLRHLIEGLHCPGAGLRFSLHATDDEKYPGLHAALSIVAA